MPRILAIDFGLKRTGLAVTDPLQLIATGLTTIETSRLFPYLKDYCSREVVERILIGDPRNEDGTATDATAGVEKCIRRLERSFPGIPIERVDERYTSKMAQAAMLEMGLSRKKRQEKGRIDEIAATIILQEYLGHRS